MDCSSVHWVGKRNQVFTSSGASAYAGHNGRQTGSVVFFMPYAENSSTGMTAQNFIYRFHTMEAE